MGHSQYPHGLHSTGFLTIGWRALSSAAQRWGSAGPKIVRLGASTAFAIWDGPVSLLMKRSNLLMSAAILPVEFYRQGSAVEPSYTLPYLVLLAYHQDYRSRLFARYSGCRSTPRPS